MWKNVPAGSASTSSAQPRRWKSRPSSENVILIGAHAYGPRRRRSTRTAAAAAAAPAENPPPEKPLEPEPLGVDAIVPPVVTENPSTECAKSAKTNGRLETYHDVSGSDPERLERLRPLLGAPEHHGVRQVAREDVLLLGPARHVGLRLLDHRAEPADPPQHRRALRRARRHALGPHRAARAPPTTTGSPSRPQWVHLARTNVRRPPSEHEQDARGRAHRARTLSGRAREPPALHGVDVQRLLHPFEPLVRTWCAGWRA